MFEKFRVLVVDDNAHMQRIMCQILYELGVSTFESCGSGEEALALFEEFQPNVLLLDNIMKPLDGTELTRMIRNGETVLDRFTPIIMVSGETSKDLIVAARDAGITEFVAKPLSAKLLLLRFKSISETPRPFVETNNFFGPDRRRRQINVPMGDRRHEPYDYSGPTRSKDRDKD